MYFVCQRARQDVKVALIGQGPDELFGGYKRHLGVHYGDWWRGFPEGLRSMAGFAVNRLPRNEALKRGVRSLGSEDRLKRYQDVFSLAPPDTINGLFRRCLPQRKGRNGRFLARLAPQMEHTDELGGFQLLEIRSSLPDELLMYADKLSMAHSLEVRVPYLDRTVVEYAQRLGADLKSATARANGCIGRFASVTSPANSQTQEARLCGQRGGRLVSLFAQRRTSGNAPG